MKGLKTPIWIIDRPIGILALVAVLMFGMGLGGMIVALSTQGCR